MLGNSWFKKENPLLGLTGMAGGAAPLGGGGTPGIYKASGGQVEMQWESPTGGMSIHIFTAPGQTFACPPTFNETCHFVIIGGGGGGGVDRWEENRGAGGGGAGLLNTSPRTVSGSHSVPITIGAGGDGGQNSDPDCQGSQGGGTSSPPIGGSPISCPGGGGGGRHQDGPGGSPYNSDGGPGGNGG